MLRRLVFALALALVLIPPVLSAETKPDPQQPDLYADIDPQQLQKARAGDPGASYEVGRELSSTSNDARLRASIPFLETAWLAYEGGIDETTRELRANTGYMLGYALSGLADYDQALIYYREATAFFRDISTRPDAWFYAAGGAEAQGFVLQGMSRYAESLELFAAARAAYGGQNPQGAVHPFNIGSTWLNEGISLENMERFEEALAAYQTALPLFEQTTGTEGAEYGYVIANMGWLFTRMERFDEARQYMERGLDAILRSDGSFSLNATKARINLGLVSLETGRTDEAIRWVMQVMPYVAENRLTTLSDQRWAFELLQRAFARKGNPTRAILFGKLAVNAQQEIRALNADLSEAETSGLRDEWRRLYQELAELLIGQGRISEAQAVLNMEKEQEVFEFLQRDATADITKTRAILNDGELGVEAQLAALAAIPIAAERELSRLYALSDAGKATPGEEAQIATLEAALQQATEDFDAQVDDFLAAIEPEAKATFDAQFDSVGTYQATLARMTRPTAILQIAALPEAVHLFLTLPEVSLHRQIDIERADLARMVFDTLQAIEDRDPDADKPLQALYQVVMAPVRADLDAAGVEVVMLNLDGFLRYVPFAALHDGSQYLVEGFAFSLYSAAINTQFGAATHDPKHTAGFGVTQAHDGFSALPGVKKEIDTIFAPGSGALSGETELDAQFDLSSLKATLRGKPGILHIASHFALMPGREDDSFLLLGDGTHLSLAAIRSERSLRFKGVDLVTLSACQTARGGDGSELDGFGATAQLSGASAVMASLWPVADQATPELMADFYRGLVTDGLDKAEALRQAQLAMLRGAATGGETERGGTSLRRPAGDSPKPIDQSHPYFWSAFVLMGNWL